MRKFLFIALLAVVSLFTISACTQSQVVDPISDPGHLLEPACTQCGYVNLDLEGTLTVTHTTVAGGTSQRWLEGLDCDGSQIPVKASVRTVLRSDLTVQGKPVTRPLKLVQFELDCSR